MLLSCNRLAVELESKLMQENQRIQEPVCLQEFQVSGARVIDWFSKDSSQMLHGFAKE